MKYYFSILLGFCLLITIFGRSGDSLEADTLFLVHVLSRHGDRTPDINGLWESNPYYNESFYEPYGYGQLTNKGKNRMYDLGVALRQRYNTFLGPNWNIKLIEAWCTDSNRTKMSISLLLAGLFPPSGQLLWRDDMPWQPIPFNYLPLYQDPILTSWACPTVLPLLYNDSSVAVKLMAYDQLLEELSNGTGEQMDYITMLDAYYTMEIQRQLGYTLENWTQSIFPDKLKNYTLDFYDIETSTLKLKQIMAGYFLKKILQDTNDKITGKLRPNERKMFLYTAHETNLGCFLRALDLIDLTDIPPYGSYILFEIHRIESVYGIKISYQDNNSIEPHQLTLKGCNHFCPLDKFTEILADIIPESDLVCYGDDIK